MRRVSSQVVAVAVWWALIAASFAGASAIESTLAWRPGPNEYNVHAWEVRNFANKWLFHVGQGIHGRPTAEEQDLILVWFFETVREVDALERRVSDAERLGTPDSALQADLEQKLRERERLARQAAATIEARISAVAAEEGLTLGLPIVGGLVWPPVNIEFTSSPRTLVTSPRDRIELTGSTLLREGLTVAEIEEIESRREQRDGVSTLAFPTSGVGTYPAIVTYTTDYRRAVDVAAHEWMHNYLFFKPLGIRYYRSNDLRTMNEVVADIVGREVSEAVHARWPLPGQPAPAPPETRPEGVDLDAELRQLRLEVDGLLADGLIEDAEVLMEERRVELASRGVYIRKINQAFFAFTNLYAGEAGSPGAVNPIGPMLDELRRRSTSLGEFIRLVEGFTSVEDVERALAATEG
jgi:hypothetical protein